MHSKFGGFMTPLPGCPPAPQHGAHGLNYFQAVSDRLNELRASSLGHTRHRLDQVRSPGYPAYLADNPRPSRYPTRFYPPRARGSPIHPMRQHFDHDGQRTVSYIYFFWKPENGFKVGGS